jgi:hypothetical protein
MPVAGQRPNNGVAFPLQSVLRTRCWANVVISFQSVPRLLPKLIILREPFILKNKFELECTPVLSILCPWSLDGLRVGHPRLDSQQGQDKVVISFGGPRRSSRSE